MTQVILINAKVMRESVLEIRVSEFDRNIIFSYIIVYS